MTYPTTVELLDALEATTGEPRLNSVYLHRWRGVGLVRPLERAYGGRGFVWPDWTLAMARLIRLELRGSPLGAQRAGARNMVDVLADVAGALEVEPDAVFVTITADGNVETHRDADTVAHRCTTTGNVLIVAIPTN